MTKEIESIQEAIELYLEGKTDNLGLALSRLEELKKKNFKVTPVKRLVFDGGKYKFIME